MRGYSSDLCGVWTQSARLFLETVACRARSRRLWRRSRALLRNRSRPQPKSFYRGSESKRRWQRRSRESATWRSVSKSLVITNEDPCRTRSCRQCLSRYLRRYRPGWLQLSTPRRPFPFRATAHRRRPRRRRRRRRRRHRLPHRPRCRRRSRLRCRHRCRLRHRPRSQLQQQLRRRLMRPWSRAIPQTRRRLPPPPPPKRARARSRPRPATETR